MKSEHFTQRGVINIDVTHKCLTYLITLLIGFIIKVPFHTSVLEWQNTH